MIKTITLQFDDYTKNALGGDDLGAKTFKEQVEPNVNDDDYHKGFKIIFPNHINIIGSSFMQGFSRGMIQKIGYDGVSRLIKFETISERLTKEVYDDIL